MKTNEHLIEKVVPHSLADKAGIKENDTVVSINGNTIEDIFDYQYMCEDTCVDIQICDAKGNIKDFHFDKEEDEDLGLVFANGLMDEYRHCSNKCIFCFIDQMPKGMRETLYFKDDDSRLSFLQGNYITLTNMSEHDVDRIIKYRLGPINISFQTMNPTLRCKMLNNRFAGDALLKVKRLHEAGISMNGQIVLCKGVNDGDELKYSLEQLYEYAPVLQSVSIVPVGLTRFREGLYPLEPFNEDDALEVIDLIESWQKKAYKEHGIHLFHASDEWYIMAGRELPQEERYDGYLQIENGVGMVRSMLAEFDDALNEAVEKYGPKKNPLANLFAKGVKAEHITIVTGMLIKDYIQKMADCFMKKFPQKQIDVLPIRNDFFGERITVSGLLTGKDIIAQCKQCGELGDRILLPQCVVRSDSEILLDDITVSDISKALGRSVTLSGVGGYGLVDALL